MASHPIDVEQRSTPRFALHLVATMRERGRGRFPVTLVDLSEGGCRAEIPAELAVGSWVWLNITGLETQYCRVVWCRDTLAGFEFATPLSRLVVQNLAGDGVISEQARARLRAVASRCEELARLNSGAADELNALARNCTVKAVGDDLAARFG
jgi:hypothetical protein